MGRRSARRAVGADPVPRPAPRARRRRRRGAPPQRAVVGDRGGPSWRSPGAEHLPGYTRADRPPAAAAHGALPGEVPARRARPAGRSPQRSASTRHGATRTALPASSPRRWAWRCSARAAALVIGATEPISRRPAAPRSAIAVGCCSSASPPSPGSDACGPRLATAAFLGLAAADLYRVNAPPAADARLERAAPRAADGARVMARGDDPLRIYSDAVGRPPVPPFPDSFIGRSSICC